MRLTVDEQSTPSRRQVRCPHCGGPAYFDTDNRWRPFCSQACRERDLGAWASESFRVPTSPPDPDNQDGSAS